MKDQFLFVHIGQEKIIKSHKIYLRYNVPKKGHLKGNVADTH